MDEEMYVEEETYECQNCGMETNPVRNAYEPESLICEFCGSEDLKRIE